MQAETPRQHKKSSLSKLWLLRAFVIFAICIVFASIAPLYATISAKDDLYSTIDVPKNDVAIIFGAGLEAPGKPSNFLASRLESGLSLYKLGSAKFLVVTGDNRKAGYDEPTAMRDYLIQRGVPREKIALDYAGFNTYDSCYRAYKIFGIKKATLVTHGYHLPRAIMTCRSAGIDSIGVRADRSAHVPKTYYVREYFSLNKAAVESVLNLEPTVLGRQEQSVQQALQAN